MSPLGIYWPWERVSSLADRAGLEKGEYGERCLDDMKAFQVNRLEVVNLSAAVWGGHHPP